MIVETESGSIYEIDGQQIRRTNAGAKKRGDGVWLTLVNLFPLVPRVGSPMLLVVKSLAKYGPDDFGTPKDQASSETTRRTTAVTKVIARKDI